MPTRLSGFRRVAAILAAVFSAALPASPAQADETPSAEEKPGLLALFFSPHSGLPETAGVDAALAVQELQVVPQLPDTIDLTAPTDDLWQRIRNGFGMPNLNNDLVLHHQQWYQNRPELLRRIVERSRRYLHHIVEELEKRGMPTELALLPMVESAYNPMALSPAQASGLWQFIPSTGKTYKLEQNWWQDQRRDIVASTSAALEYLQTIYDMHGDWQLALASYNWGEWAVKRAIEKNAAKGLPTDYSGLTMPNETRHYVPKLQALKNIFGNPKLLAELNLPEVPNRPYFATIESNRPMDLATAAKLAGVPLNEFVALNPAHNRPVIQADTPVVIPADKLEFFQFNLENHDEPLSRWQTYTLKPGEKLDKLAPRFGISLADLRRVNGLHGHLKISAGSTLLVPTTKGEANIDELPNLPRLPEIKAQAAERKVSAGKGDPKALGKAGKKLALAEKPLGKGGRHLLAPVGRLARQEKGAKPGVPHGAGKLAGRTAPVQAGKKTAVAAKPAKPATSPPAKKIQVAKAGRG